MVQATNAPTAGGNTASVERTHSRAHFDPRVELWEQEGGNPVFTYFHLPMKTRNGVPLPPDSSHVEKAFLQTGKYWLERMYKDGWIAMESTIACLGPYVVPELEKLDQWTFYIGCRFKRRAPEILTLDHEQALRDVEPVKVGKGNDFRKFLRRIAPMGAFGMEKNIAGVKERAEEERKLQEEVEEINKRKGTG